MDITSSVSFFPNDEFILLDNKGHNPNYTIEAVKYLNEYQKQKKKYKKQKKLENTKQKEKFIQTFDWNMMTTQDEDVWQEIINWLNS